MNRLDDLKEIGKYVFRFNSLLLDIYIKKGDAPQARALMKDLLKQPTYKFYEKKMEELEAALVKLEAQPQKKAVARKKGKVEE